MQLTHVSGLDDEQARGNMLRYREVARVDDANFACWDGFQRLHRPHTEGVLLLRCHLLATNLRFVLFERAGQVAGEDVEWRPGRLREDTLIQARILCQYLRRRVCYPLGKKHCPIFRKRRLVEDQQKLRSIRTKPLNGMWVACGKDPKIAFAHVADEHVAIG